MNVKVLSEYYALIKTITDSNVSIEEYQYELKMMIEKIKGYLSVHFGKNITFVKEDSLGCLYAIFKGTTLIIDMTNGISLTIADNDKKYLLSELELMFSKIFGQNKTFSYDFKSKNNNQTYPTLEWAINPEKRISELNKDNSIHNLKDYYTEEVIVNLGKDLLSMDGYIKLFGENSEDETYKIIQIQKVYPNLKSSILQSWISSCRGQLIKVKRAS